MKTKYFSCLACAAIALSGAISCSKSSDDPKPDDPNGGNETTYTLIASPLSLSFGWSNPTSQSITVTTNSPEGFEIGKTADWYTAQKEGNKVVVTPQANNGDARTHELEIKAKGATSAKILISQEKKGEVHPSLTGSKYIIWQVDEKTVEFLGTKVIQSMVPDGAKRNLYVWDDGKCFIGVEATGPNFYGNMSGYVNFQVGNSGWSGAGYTAGKEDFEAFKQIVTDGGKGWFFHAAVKGNKGQGDHFTIWAKDETKNIEISWDNYLNDTFGEWCEIEVSMEDFVAKGWTPKEEDANGLSVHGGGKAGDPLAYDAVFIYKK